MMSIMQTDISPMDLLGQRLRDRFPEITSSTSMAGNEYFVIEIACATDAAPFMKEFYGFVKQYLDMNGDTEIEYSFTIYRGNELVNIITYNSESSGFRVAVDLNGDRQSLYVVDVMGATGIFTVFDADFGTVGYLSMKEEVPLDLLTEEDMQTPLVNFNDSSLWTASNDTLASVMHEIIAQISNSNFWVEGGWKDFHEQFDKKDFEIRVESAVRKNLGIKDPKT